MTTANIIDISKPLLFHLKATRMIVLRTILVLVRIYMMLFDIMTFPIYYIFQKSFKDTRREALGKVRVFELCLHCNNFNLIVHQEM